MILHRDGSGRRLGTEPKPASVPELARVLRGTRLARGLHLADVSRQTGVPVEQLQDLESGTVDRLPDRVAILKALSRYAAFLGLPADQFVMALVERWPTSSAAQPVVVVHDGTVAVAPVPTTTSLGGSAGTTTDPADLSTRVVPVSQPRPARTDVSGLVIAEGVHPTTAPVPMVVVDTGVTPAVRRSGDGPLMVLVRSLALLAAILLFLGVAWLVLNRERPQWLADLHLPYASAGASGATAATVATTPPVDHVTTTTVPTTTAAVPHGRPTMQFVSANSSEASFSLNAPTFEVRVSAQGGDTWLEATDPLSTQPAYEGILQNGQSEVVPANHQLSIQIGSSAARVAVLVNNKVVGTYVPPAAPFTMTFTTS